MRVRTIFGVALIAVMGVACNKNTNPEPPVIEPEEPQMLYVKSIVSSSDTHGDEYYDALEFTINSDMRITSMRSTYSDGYTEPIIDIMYGDGTATISYTYDGETGNIFCELNDQGAITSTSYDGMLSDFVETFTYNNAGELQTYVVCYANYSYMTLNYEWRDGNIYKIRYEDSEDQMTFTHEYTTEPNIYNIDIFPGCTLATPIICEIALAVNDGLLGKKNKGFLTSIIYEGEAIPIFDYTFKENGELDRASDDSGYITFECFSNL